MRDPLKESIDRHRPELDTAEPSAELWQKIETKMIATQPVSIHSGKSWLKYFAFGASAIAAGIVVYSLNSQPYSSASSAASNSIPAQVLSQPQTIPASSATSSSFVSNTETGEQQSPAQPALSFTGKTQEPAEQDMQNGKTEPENILQEYSSSSAQNDAPAPDGTVKKEGTTILLDTLFTGISRLEISCSSADINVKGGNNAGVKITGKLQCEVKGAHIGNTHYTVTYERHDSLLKVNAVLTCSKNNFGSICVSKNTAVLNFELPEGIDLTVKNTYGDSNISGLNGGHCSLTQSSGDIALTDSKTDVVANTTYGDLTVSHITGKLNSKLSSGDIKADHITGDIDLVSTYGNIRLSEITGRMLIRGSSGDITLTNASGDADITTSYGNIRVENYKGTPKFTSGSGDITGKKVELTGNTDLKTTYGNINMELVNGLDALSFDLSVTYGQILIDKNGQQVKQEKSYSMQKGNILIRATSNSGDQTYR